jgi:hypothetical protein
LGKKPWKKIPKKNLGILGKKRCHTKIPEKPSKKKAQRNPRKILQNYHALSTPVNPVNLNLSASVNPVNLIVNPVNLRQPCQPDHQLLST